MQAASLHLRQTKLLLLAHAPPNPTRSSPSVTGVMCWLYLSFALLPKAENTTYQTQMMSNPDFSKYISTVDAEIFLHSWEMQKYCSNFGECRNNYILQVFLHSKGCRNVHPVLQRYCSISKEYRNIWPFPVIAEILHIADVLLHHFLQNAGIF